MANVKLVEVFLRHTILNEDLDRLKATIGTTKTQKPIAFIFGHGLWSDLDVSKSLIWLDAILDIIKHQLPHLADSKALWPRLFVTPNAVGKQKPKGGLVAQGNKDLMLFEEAMKVEVEERGLEHLGTWNMSIQADNYDGGHMDMKGNLVKTMMVLNWLNLLPVAK
jgi:hypothetical protein